MRVCESPQGPNRTKILTPDPFPGVSVKGASRTDLMAEPEWIETPEALAELADHLRSAGRFAFDTEFVSEDTFEPILCLVQVATTDRLAVVDPLAVGDLAAFWAVVNDPAVEVVMHAAGEDLRIGRFQSGRVPTRVVDVQIAAGLVGPSYPMSLSNLIQQVVGVHLAGGETRTDWRRRPLSEAQVKYALDDVVYLLEAADRLDGRLDALGRRGWAEAEYASMLETIAGRHEEERWRRLSGLHMLNRRGLEVARRLVDWRRDDARRANRPLRSALRDDLLVAIAKRQPARRADLEALRDFNRGHLGAKADALIAVIAQALAVPDDQLPEPAERHDDGPGRSMVVNLLAATLTLRCADAGVAASLVGTNSDLKDLARWSALGCHEDRRPSLASGWRGEVCGESILDVLMGRSALRIDDPEAEIPVSLVPTPG